MLNIAINIGSYSLKILTFRVDKKKIRYIESKEIVLDSDEFNILEEDIVLDLQLKIISQYLSEVDEEHKLILNIPNDLITTRFLHIPVKNKKKAQVMIPFQLEEDIPFLPGECHLASSLDLYKDKCHAVVNIATHENFKFFYDKLLSYNIRPAIVTSEFSAIGLFARKTQHILPQSFCILDVGHSSTKGHFFLENEFMSTHRSYIAGVTINEAISKNYSVSMEEASLYKHRNGFFLTSGQTEQVNDDQKEFAKLMDDVFNPLCDDIKRWLIGHRVQTGIPVNEIFIIGGSSNLKNITHYLSEKLEAKVTNLPFFSEDAKGKIDSDDKQRRKLAVAHTLAMGQQYKSDTANFLTGQYTIQGQGELPLHSFAFAATRVAFVTIMLIISLSIERFFISGDLKEVDKKLAAVVKNPSLNLSPRDRRLVKKDPKKVLARIKRNNRNIEQQISTLQSAAEINSLQILKTLAQVLSGSKAEIIQMQSTSLGEYTVVFQVENSKALEQLEQTLLSAGLTDAFIEKKASNNQLVLNGTQE